MNSSDSEDNAATILSPLRLAYGAESLQFGDLYMPKGSGPHPVVILIHGGFWRAAYRLTLMQELASDLVEKGIAAWNIEYRRVGDAGGGWPGTLQDVAHAADYLATLAPTYALDLTRVVPVALAGVVSLAGASDLNLVWHLDLGHGAATEFLGGSPTKVPERYFTASPAALLPLGIPQVLIHGNRDDLVPLSVSQDYVQKATLARDRVTLIVLPEADHFALINPTSPAWGITIVEIQKLQNRR